MFDNKKFVTLKWLNIIHGTLPPLALEFVIIFVRINIVLIMLWFILLFQIKFNNDKVRLQWVNSCIYLWMLIVLDSTLQQ